jgi:hypothetical protein
MIRSMQRFAVATLVLTTGAVFAVTACSGKGACQYPERTARIDKRDYYTRFPKECADAGPDVLTCPCPVPGDNLAVYCSAILPTPGEFLCAKFDPHIPIELVPDASDSATCVYRGKEGDCNDGFIL